MKLAGICLETSNVQRLVDFYSKVLCLKAEGNDKHSVFNEASLAIFNPGNLDESAKMNKCFILMFEVDDVDYEYERLKKLDIIEFTSLPTTQPWGCRAMSFKDPDNNKVDIYTNIVISQ